MSRPAQSRMTPSLASHSGLVKFGRQLELTRLRSGKRPPCERLVETAFVLKTAYGGGSSGCVLASSSMMRLSDSGWGAMRSVIARLSPQGGGRARQAQRVSLAVSEAREPPPSAGDRPNGDVKRRVALGLLLDGRVNVDLAREEEGRERSVAVDRQGKVHVSGRHPAASCTTRPNYKRKSGASSMTSSPLAIGRTATAPSSLSGIGLTATSLAREE